MYVDILACQSPQVGLVCEKICMGPLKATARLVMTINLIEANQIEWNIININNKKKPMP